MEEPSFKIDSLQYIFPDKENFKSDFWWFVLSYFLVLLYPENPENTQKRNQAELTEYLTTRCRKLQAKYDRFMVDLDEKGKTIIYSIMIYEDYNRSKIDRFFEKIFFYLGKKDMTTGIMQVKNNKFLTDEESVEIIVNRYKEHKQYYDANKPIYNYNFPNDDGSLKSIYNTWNDNYSTDRLIDDHNPHDPEYRRQIQDLEIILRDAGILIL